MNLLFTICIGELQFGISIIVWNSAWVPYAALLELNKDDPDLYYHQLTTQSLVQIGTMIGALGAGPIAYLGRWRMIMATNVITLASSLI